MDIFFADPSEVPLPPDEVRIRRLQAEPSPDGKRLHIYLEVDPFQKRPSAELNVFDPSGKQVASADIIETMNRILELNLHLRGAVASGEYKVDAILYYADLPDAESKDPDPVERQVVDRAQEKLQIRL